MSQLRNSDVYDQQGFGQPLELVSPTGLLIVDFVNGFADPGVFGGGNVQAAIERTVDLLAMARERGWMVAYTRVVYVADGSDDNVFTEKVPGNLNLTESSTASQVVAELRPAAGELIVSKQFPSAFFGTTLASSLTRRGVKTLVIAGATTSGCVRASVLDAMCHGFKPVVAADCVGDRSIEQHESNLFDMRMKYAEVMTLAEISGVAALQTG